MNYRNPIITGFHPDPSIVRVDSDYYLVNSSFEYLPGVPLFHSTDLVNWKHHSNVLTRDSQIEMHDTFDSGGVYAPTIRYHDGVFYMITTNINKGNFIVTSANLDDGWSDPVFIEEAPGIDPSLYFEGDRVYMQYSRLQYGIWQGELDINTGQFIGEHQLISNGCGGRDPEGPHIYKIGEYYYLLCAEGGTREGHMITLQRSKSIWGPFEQCPTNPIITNRDHSKEVLQAVGHADLFEDEKGQWWIVALAHRAKKRKHVLGRETILLPIEWSDGWFSTKDGTAPSVIETDKLYAQQQPITSFYDDFKEDTLSVSWNTLRDFLKDQIRIGKGVLRLKGNSYTLNEEGKHPSFVTTRQKGWVGKWQITIEDSSNEGECGVSLYMDHAHHIDFGLKTQSDGSKYLFVRKCVGDIQHIDNSIQINDPRLTLIIESNETYYTFSYLTVDGSVKKVDQTLCKHLATEVAIAMFNGVMCGMYVYGEGKETSFKNFRYEFDPYS